MKSEQINELATALCKMQGQLEDTCKSTQAYNYKYSDLSSILTYIRPIMSENGLSVSQLVNGEGSGQIGVETILLHNSGQWLSSNSFMTVQGQNLAQEAGKIITYLRRYSLAAIIGLTQRDEDATLATPVKKLSKAAAKRIAGEISSEWFRLVQSQDAHGLRQIVDESSPEEITAVRILLDDDILESSRELLQSIK